MSSFRHPAARSTAVRRATGLFVLGLAIAFVFSAPAHSQPAPITISFDQPAYDANDMIVLTIEGTPGDYPVMLANLEPGPTVIPGIGTLDVAMPVPALYVLGPIPASGQVVLTCEQDCNSPIIGLPLFFQVLTFRPGMKGPSGLSNGAMLLVLNGDCEECVRSTVPDPKWSPWPSTQALILDPLGLDFQMLPGGQFSEYADGTAHLTGVVARTSDGSARFLVDITFSDRLVVGDAGFLPPGSPKQELAPGAYAMNGGPIAPLLWRYYPTLQGTLTGLDGYAGGQLSVTRTGPSFQVGPGASGKNLDYGASCWLEVEILSQPTTGVTFPAISQADLNINLGGDCGM